MLFLDFGNQSNTSSSTAFICETMENNTDQNGGNQWQTTTLQ
jgi:hypothetical protein